MRASRLLTIQMLLETRGRMSAAQLSEILAVSVRTLYRDVDQLAAAGVPIYAERGRAGGFELLAGWKTTLTGLTASEAKAVLLSGLAGPASALGLGEAVADAKLKLLSALPRSQRDEAEHFQSRFHLDPLEWYRQSESVPQLATVAEAVWQDRRLAIHYESWAGASQRVVHPLGLVMKAGSWYLVARSKDTPLTFRIANIAAATLLPEACARPRAFDLAAYWAESIQRFEAELYAGYAEVKANARGRKALRGLSAAVANAVTQAANAGETTLRIPIENIEHACAQLLPLAPDVVVKAPPGLRSAIRKKLREIGKAYARG